MIGTINNVLSFLTCMTFSPVIAVVYQVTFRLTDALRPA